MRLHKKGVQTKGYCAVTADILHIGHIIFLENCKDNCKHLTVGVMSDKCVEKYKGERPVMSENDRMMIIRSLRCVDRVVLQKQFDFPKLKNTIIFDSTEHRRRGGDILIPRVQGISSSKIKEKCRTELEQSQSISFGTSSTFRD